MICFYLGWSGGFLHFRQNIIKVGSKSWLLTYFKEIIVDLLKTSSSVVIRFIKNITMRNLENKKKDKGQEVDFIIVNFANQAITNIEVKRNLGKSSKSHSRPVNLHPLFLKVGHPAF